MNNNKTLKKSIVAASVAAGVAGGLVAGLALGVPGFAGASSTGPKGAAVTFAEAATPKVSAAADTNADTPTVVEGGASDSAATVETQGHRGPRGPKLDAAATAIGITADELRAELEAGKSIADIAKEKGVSVDVVIDALVAEAKTRITETVNTAGLPAPKGGEGHGRGGKHGGKGLDVAATAMGMTTDELRTKLQAGKSIADVATAKGVSVDVVIDAMVADMKAHLDEEVASGEHTQEEADAKLAEAKTRITEMVNRTAPPRGEIGSMAEGKGHGPRGDHGPRGEGHGPRGEGHGPRD